MRLFSEADRRAAELRWGYAVAITAAGRQLTPITHRGGGRMAHIAVGRRSPLGRIVNWRVYDLTGRRIVSGSTRAHSDDPGQDFGAVRRAVLAVRRYGCTTRVRAHE